MAEILKPEQFEVAPGVRGREVLSGFGFTQDECRIEVSDDGTLVITHKKLSITHKCSPECWRRIACE